MTAEQIALMRDRARTLAADAQNRPGLYETNGHAVADLYDCIAMLCAHILETGGNE